MFSYLCDVANPEQEIEIKSRYLNTPWINKGLRNSCKRKQCLYEEYLKLLSKANASKLIREN